MSRATYWLPASSLILLTAGLSPPHASAEARVTNDQTPPGYLEAAVLPASERPWAAVSSSPILAPDTVTGTVSNVHAEDATVQVITGIHLALRVVTFRVIAETRIERAGESIAIEGLAPGDVVRIDYRATPEGNIADAIRVVAPPDEGGGR